MDSSKTEDDVAIEAVERAPYVPPEFIEHGKAGDITTGTTTGGGVDDGGGPPIYSS